MLDSIDKLVTWRAFCQVDSKIKFYARDFRSFWYFGQKFTRISRIPPAVRVRFTQPCDEYMIAAAVVVKFAMFLPLHLTDSVPRLPALRHLFLQVSLRLCVRARGQRGPRRPIQLRQDSCRLHVLNGPAQHHPLDADARFDDDGQSC